MSYEGYVKRNFLILNGVIMMATMKDSSILLQLVIFVRENPKYFK